jgi:heme-degrading monooxygenase HmoA
MQFGPASTICWIQGLKGIDDQLTKEGRAKNMAIRVLMKRKFSEDKADALRELTGKLRVLAMDQSGYVSGETLTRIDRPGVSLVISKWKSRQAWEHWFKTPQREKVQKEIDELLGVETEYEIYDYD